MPETQPADNFPAAGPPLRWFTLCTGIGLVILLVVASRLTPNPSGFGTHQQLGLPPCSSTLIWGMRCPACGMTTSWAYFTHGQFTSSLHVNPGGFLLACQALASLPFLLYAGIFNRCLSNSFMVFTLSGVVLTAIVSLVHWVIRDMIA